MRESSSDRFRRIVKLWREDECAKPRTPSPPSTLAKPNHTPQPGPQPPEPTPQPRTPSQSSTNNTPPSLVDRLVPQVQPSQPVEQALSTPSPIQMPPLEPAPNLDELRTPADARGFLERLRTKTTKVVQDFATGVINQRQFQAIYSHYQRQRLAVEKALIEMPGSGAWRAAAVEGHTSFLRQQHAAQVLSYAIYETASGVPLAQVGDFAVDPGLLVPMLSSFRSITQELFGAGMKRTEIEGGRWLCFVPGRYTTLIVIFSAEPATLQLQMIEDLHRDFEYVNQMALSNGDVSRLALTFTHLWAFEQPSET